MIPQMKTGTYIHSNGGYPRMSAGPQRDKFVHVLVAEAMLGRELKKDEIVHHLDGNTKNCRWSNLKVLDKKIHNAVSNRQYWYLKQKYSREEAAWRAYFDVTGAPEVLSDPTEPSELTALSTGALTSA